MGGAGALVLILFIGDAFGVVNGWDGLMGRGDGAVVRQCGPVRARWTLLRFALPARPLAAGAQERASAGFSTPTGRMESTSHVACLPPTRHVRPPRTTRDHADGDASAPKFDF